MILRFPGVWGGSGWGVEERRRGKRNTPEIFLETERDE